MSGFNPSIKAVFGRTSVVSGWVKDTIHKSTTETPSMPTPPTSPPPTPKTTATTIPTGSSCQSCGLSNPRPSGKRNPDEDGLGRIFGGLEAGENEYPWQAMIMDIYGKVSVFERSRVPWFRDEDEKITLKNAQIRQKAGNFLFSGTELNRHSENPPFGSGSKFPT